MGAFEEVINGFIGAFTSWALVKASDVVPHVHDWEPSVHYFARLHSFCLG